MSQSIYGKTEMIEFVCSNKECGQDLKVDGKYAGKRVQCPKCKTIMAVPKSGRGSPPSENRGMDATTVLPREPGEPGKPHPDGRAPDKKRSEASATRAVATVTELERLLEETNAVVRRYAQERELGHGGMGTVFQCRDKTLGRPVAMKIMRPRIADSDEHRLRFLEEAQVTGQLEHPNIVPVHELGRDSSGNLYFTMKLVKGKSLGDIIREMREGQPGLSLSEFLGVFLKACDAIAFAHARGIIHRDLKPDNIMVGDFGEVLVMDWGLAKPYERRSWDDEADGAPDGSAGQGAVSQSPEPQGEAVRSIRALADLAQTKEGVIQGSPVYMSPEQAEGRIQLLDQRSDIYSLGAILYEILTLERPIRGNTIHEVLLKVTAGKIVPPERRTPGRHIPRELSAVVMKAMAKGRRERYSSVRHLVRDVNLFLEGRAVSAKEDTFLETLTKLMKRNRAVMAAIAAGLVVVIGLTGAFMVELKRQRDESRVQERLAADALKRMEKARDDRATTQDERDTAALEASKELALLAARAAEGGFFAEAAVRADTAQKLAPAGPWGPFALATISWEKRDLTSAEQHLKQALLADPSHAPSAALLARVYSTRHQLSEALAILGKVGVIIEWRTAVTTGDIVYDAGDFLKAREAYQKALNLMASAKDATPEHRRETEEKLRRVAAWAACDGFYDSISKMPPENQFSWIRLKMNELHTPDPCNLSFEADQGVLRRLTLTGPPVKFLQPIHGLPLTGLRIERTLVEDLAPLRGLALRSLSLAGSPVRDLTPITHMPLASLDITRTRVEDLSAVSGLPLTELLCAETRVASLSPLRGLPIQKLAIENTRVADLSPIEDAPIKELHPPPRGQLTQASLALVEKLEKSGCRIVW